MFLLINSTSSADRLPYKVLYIVTSKTFLSILSLLFFSLFLIPEFSIILQINDSNSILCLLARTSEGISVMRPKMRSRTLATLPSFHNWLAGFKKAKLDIIIIPNILFPKVELLYAIRVNDVFFAVAKTLTPEKLNLAFTNTLVAAVIL